VGQSPGRTCIFGAYRAQETRLLAKNANVVNNVYTHRLCPAHFIAASEWFPTFRSSSCSVWPVDISCRDAWRACVRGPLQLSWWWIVHQN